VLRDFALWLRPAGWPPLPDAVRGRVRALACLAITAQVVFVVGWIIAGALERGYSPLRSYVSELGRRGAAHPWIFDISVVVWGLGFIALGAALTPALRTRRWAWFAPGLFILAGALSWREYGHVWASFGIELSLLLTPFALARSLWPGRAGRLVLIGGLAVAVALALLGGLDGWFGAHSPYSGESGLWQRIWLLVVYGWVLICAAGLILEASHGWPPAREQQAAFELDEVLAPKT
jgi:hypothetical membrane protein